MSIWACLPMRPAYEKKYVYVFPLTATAGFPAAAIPSLLLKAKIARVAILLSVYHALRPTACT